MTDSRLHKLIGLIVFLIALFTYFSTVQPSVSFWDCGEFISSSYLLQVPHPPGTPFFLIVGRVLSMIPFVANIGLRVNTISVITSSFAILFLYLVSVRVINMFAKDDKKSMLQSLGTYVASAVGALSLAFADTFWFNAVEAEVYASSTFFIAFVIWLLMIWWEKADEKYSEKYLILIAYLIGLATGVHLMAVLAIVPILMVIVFRKYTDNDETLKKTAYLFLGHAAIVLVVFLAMWSAMTHTSPPTPEQYKMVDSRFVWIFIAISAVYMGVFWKKIFAKNSFYISIIVGGVALMVVYPGIVKYVPNFLRWIGGDSTFIGAVVFLGILSLLAYIVYWGRREKRETVALTAKALFFIFIGYSSYIMIVIRANEHPPINLNDPRDLSSLVSYLNREQYGDFPIFQRRYSQEPHQQGIYTNYSSDLDFLLKYQINHMFHRYLFWNYIGRVSTVQDAGVDWKQLFYIPFLFGLLGLYYHFKKDWKMASVFLMMFIFLGYLTAFYQNQQQPQPRERDYFYVGAFFVFSLWISLGVKGTLDIVTETLRNKKVFKVAYYSVLLFAVVFVPYNMARTNWFTHDRSRNYVPWDYSYNLLQSVKPNAILFTNGDNDTFPLWYLQNVEGVRRDVRIANLSLLNTDWYIKQLKNERPFGTKPVPISYSDLEISRLGPMRWKTKKITVPVPKEVYKEFGVTDSSIIKQGKIEWTMKNTANFGGIKAVRTQDLIVLDIVKTSRWKRPVYFAVTCSDESKIGLNDYLKMEGLAFRVMPFKTGNYYEAVDSSIMYKQLFNEPKGFSRTYKPGFKFRGLNDSTIFLNENHRRLTINYRNAYIRLALNYLYAKHDKKMTIKTLDEMEKKIPRKIIPMDYRLLNDVGNIYFMAGAVDTYKKIARKIEKIALQKLDEDPENIYGDYNPYFLLKGIYDNLQEYDKFVKVLQRLQAVRPQDKSVQDLINQYRIKAMLKNKTKKDSISKSKKK